MSREEPPGGASWERVSELVSRALRLEPEERRALVASLRTSDPELAATVEALLEVPEPALTLVDRPRLSAVLASSPASEGGGESGPATAVRARLPELAPGHVVGEYRVERLLAQGGTGTVYVAADLRHGREVALKLLAPSMRALAERESRLLARLVHPGIAALYASGTTADGFPYLALELVTGQPIDVACRERGLGLRERLALFLEVCEAVAFAHRHQVVHRDLKPSNVLVGADGRVKLLDFGISRLALEDAEPGEATRQATQFLSLAFASPEQVLGRWSGTATDVYSLGVVLYLLLTGASPYTVGSSFGLPAAIVAGRIETPSRRLAETAVAGDADGRTEWEAALRRDLDPVVMKALRTDPEDRYPGVDALADDLRRFLRHEPVTARRGARAYRLAKFAYRNRLPLALGTIAAVGLAVGSGVALLQWRRAVESQAAAEVARARQELAAATLRDAFAASERTEGLGRSGALAAAEIYDPATDTFTLTGTLRVPRAEAAAVKLDDGRVLVLGGRTVELLDATASAEIFDPRTGVSRLVEPMTVPRLDGFTPVLLPDGSVVVAGGVTEGAYGTATDVVERFVPTADGGGSWQRIGRLLRSRSSPAVALISRHRLLVVGGGQSCCDPAANRARATAAEIFDLAAGRSLGPIDLGGLALETPTAIPLEGGAVYVGPSGAVEPGPGLVFRGGRFLPLEDLGGGLRRRAMAARAIAERFFGTSPLRLDDGRYFSLTPKPVELEALRAEPVRELLAVARLRAAHPEWGASRLREAAKVGAMALARGLALLNREGWPPARVPTAAEAAGLTAILEGGGDRILHELAPFVAAPGLDDPGARPRLVELLRRPEGICGSADFSAAEERFLLVAERVDPATGEVAGTMRYYPLNDGAHLGFAGRVEGNELFWWHEGELAPGVAKPAFFHRARLIADDRLEGTFMRRSGTSPGSGVVKLDASPPYDRRCRRELAAADRIRAGRRETRIVGRFPAERGAPYEISDVAVRGLRAEGDPVDERAAVRFEDVRAVGAATLGEGGCRVALRRREVGGRWLAAFGDDRESCEAFHEGLVAAWTAWRTRWGDPEPAASGG